MKRIAAAILSVLLLCAASCGLRDSETSQNEENADVTIAQTAPETPAGADEEPVIEPDVTTEYPYVTLKQLELESKPYIQNGELILYFTNHEIWYEDDDAAFIGMISDGSAMSVPAAIVTSKHPELESGEDYLGVALRPSEPLPSGSYSFTVTFSEYTVSFEMTID